MYLVHDSEVCCKLHICFKAYDFKILNTNDISLRSNFPNDHWINQINLGNQVNEIILIDVQKVNLTTRFQVDSLSLPDVMEYHKSLLINMIGFCNQARRSKAMFDVSLIFHLRFWNIFNR